MPSIRLIIAALLLATGLVHLEPAMAGTSVEAAARAYVAADGYQPVALGPVDRFFVEIAGEDPEHMNLAERDISPVEKAVLLIDEREAPLTRLRYALRVRRQSFGAVTATFIDVQRFNLGPRLRAETIAAYGEEKTAGPEIFGVGPDVGWRIVSVPSAKSPAVLLAAGRRVMTAQAAETADCFGRPCLSTEPLDGYAAWTPWRDLAPLAFVTAYPGVVQPRADEEETAPALFALELASAAGLATLTTPPGIEWRLPPPQPAASTSPTLVFVIDRNLGQETMLDGAIGLAPRSKDEPIRWTRMAASLKTRQVSAGSGPLKDLENRP
ncbi:hypothetical protein E3C22_01460 [Jiella endophytica]|uniref:Uncharacterized protein n=1 Tax=Jiella endophytica TaxID=2558362 RepID=A0A4Y8RUR2_9HYPH|nr:hypothetical protein [Jiella endophytica]TFF27174.1 hypothetical protein E3C22_01460 [Jiella endophytica]